MTPTICSVDGCSTPVKTRGLCQRHDYRMRKHGVADKPARRPAEERFWSKVNFLGPAPVHAPQLGSCWLWLGARREQGYGYFHLNRRMTGSHRWAYENLRGSVPSHLHLDHLCRNPPCVNPAHLEPVTPGENVRRGWAARKDTAA